MRVKNPLDFTENHRFYVFRDFALSPTDSKMLFSIYQPMIGATAVNYYMALNQQLAADAIGYSPLEQQRKLFLLLNFPVGEAGRVASVEASSKLEAVGLLKTYRKYMADRDEWVYFYELVQPLNAYDFFQNPHLTMLLRDKIGKAQLIRVRQALSLEEANDCRGLETVDLSSVFYDLFQLNSKLVDEELEQALAEMAPAPLKVTAQPTEVPIQVEDLLLRLPRQSENRAFVEGLKNHYEQVVFINFVAHKFGLSTVDVCRLLDEEAMFWPDGTLDEDQFQKEASLLYKQSAKQTEKRQLQTGVRTEGEANEAEVSELFQEEPPQPIAQQMNREQYNFLMRNQPYTQFLKLFFPGTIPDLVDKLFIRLDVNYKLRNEVINVLIHYLKAQDLSWNKSFVETIAADMLGKQIDTFEKAVGYIREQQKFKTRKPAERSGYSGKTNGRTRPQIPVAESSGEPTVSEEEYMQILKKYQLIEGDGE